MKNDRLDVIKQEIRNLDPELKEHDRGFRIAVVLMAAAFVTGPDVERLSDFTGYAGLVADISKRMHQARLWESGVVRSDHWFDGDKWTPAFWADVLVAEGSIVTRCREDGQREYRASAAAKDRP